MTPRKRGSRTSITPSQEPGSSKGNSGCFSGPSVRVMRTRGPFFDPPPMIPRPLGGVRGGFWKVAPSPHPSPIGRGGAPSPHPSPTGRGGAPSPHPSPTGRGGCALSPFLSHRARGIAPSPHPSPTGRGGASSPHPSPTGRGGHANEKSRAPCGARPFLSRQKRGRAPAPGPWPSSDHHRCGFQRASCRSDRR